MLNFAKKSPLKGTSGPFFGKRIELEEALETAYVLVDYFTALKLNKSKLPEKPVDNLVYLLRCNKIAFHYHTKINLSLTGISYKKNYISDDQVVFAWLIAHKMNNEAQTIVLSRMQLIPTDLDVNFNGTSKSE